MPSVLSYPEWLERVRAAVVCRKAFSFVRVGDGEGIVIGYPEFTDEGSFDRRIQKWSRLEQPLTRSQRLQLAKGIREAVCAANVVGTPGNRHMDLNQDWRNTRRFLRYYSMVRGAESEMDFSVQAQREGKWPEILVGVRELYCITCRDVTEELQRVVGVERVHTFILPPQVKPNMGVCLVSEPHYPNLFQQVPHWLQTRPASGNVFLVGAGGFGKIYCHWIQQMGGVALDVGSLFDGWAGLATRSYLRENLKAYQL